MIFTETKLPGPFIIELEKFTDERGFFARAWCQDEFKAEGLQTTWAQANIGFSKKRGTLRGLHYQVAPYQEVKLMRCIRGAIYDVIVDLRPESPTYKQWLGVELSADNRQMLYIPAGFAHGYQALLDGSETFYQVSQAYTPGAEQGVRWDDPAFGIDWPIRENVILSDKDKSWPDYAPETRR
jgi:dTDP-4-dehydrorhamnose 3,5-epimerase